MKFNNRLLTTFAFVFFCALASCSKTQETNTENQTANAPSNLHPHLQQIIVHVQEADTLGKSSNDVIDALGETIKSKSLVLSEMSNEIEGTQRTCSFILDNKLTVYFRERQEEDMPPIRMLSGDGLVDSLALDDVELKVIAAELIHRVQQDKVSVDSASITSIAKYSSNAQ